jgi:hypothetical protein
LACANLLSNEPVTADKTLFLCDCESLVECLMSIYVLVEDLGITAAPGATCAGTSAAGFGVTGTGADADADS